MNLDFALVNRALMNLNMKPLDESVRGTENKDWQTAKDYYLSTMLEALAQVEWVSAKRRRELTPTQKRVKGHPGFAHVYDMPLDCAKPIELDAHEYFEVEGGLLYTDARPARLLYVSNGRRFAGQKAISGGSARRRPTDDYITGGDAGRNRPIEWGDNVVFGGNASSSFHQAGGSGEAAPPEAAEDFPDYRGLRLEPNFYLYWEYLLASKYARRLTDQPGLADVWLQKALAIGKAAEAVSAAGSAGARMAPPSWQEELGLR